MQVGQPGVITAEMNVTPMIDVLLVLIIASIVVFLFEAKFPVNLPAEKSQAGGRQQAIVLQLDAAGGYRINGQSVSEARLESRLRALFAKRLGEVLFVQAPGGVTYQQVIHAIDVAHEAGIEVIGYMP